MEIKNGCWKIYFHVFPDATIYIGITANSLQSRWRKEGKGYKGQKIYELIQKYDWNTEVEHILFADNLTADEAENMERLLICKMREISSFQVRYNISDGGIKTKIDVNEILKYWNEGYNPTTIAKIVKHDRHVVSNALKHSGITQEDISKRKSEQLGDRKRKYNYEEIYNYWCQCHNANQTMEYFHCCSDTMRRVFKTYNINPHERKMKYQERFEKEGICNNRQKVNQYTLDDAYIQTFDSFRAANKVLNKPEKSASISKACRGLQQTAYGYKWKLVE